MITSRAITSESEWLEWRRQDVTASDVAALFGLHPYKTLLELWAEKSGVDLGREKETAAMRRGRILEPSVAAAVAIERPKWTLTPSRVYLREQVSRIGATPDFDIYDQRRFVGRGILQAKTVSPSVFDEQWTAESPPFWIVLQAQTELMLRPDADFGAVAALIIDPWRFDVAIYEMEPHPEAHDRIRAAVVKFWQAVDAGAQPPADFNRDGDLLAALYPRERIERPDVNMDGNGRIAVLLRERRRLIAGKRETARWLGAINTELKAMLRDAESAYGRDWRVTWKTQKRTPRYDVGGVSRVLRITDHTGKTETVDNGNEDQDRGSNGRDARDVGF